MCLSAHLYSIVMIFHPPPSRWERGNIRQPARAPVPHARLHPHSHTTCAPSHTDARARGALLFSQATFLFFPAATAQAADNVAVDSALDCRLAVPPLRGAAQPSRCGDGVSAALIGQVRRRDLVTQVCRCAGAAVHDRSTDCLEGEKGGGEIGSAKLVGTAKREGHLNYASAKSG